MKKLILIIYSLLYLTQAIAQVEFIKRDEQKKLNMYGVTHFTDKEGDTYLLGTVGEFIDANLMRFCGPGQNLYTFYKISPSGKTIWQSRYPDYIRHVQQIFDMDSAVGIMYYINGGAVSSTSRIDFGPTSIPYYALVKKSNGKVIKRANLCYYCKFDDKGIPYYLDGPDVTFFKVAIHKDNSMSCIQSVNKKYDVKRNDHSSVMHAVNTFESFDLTNTSGFVNKLTGPQGNDFCLVDDIMHDEYDDNYIIADSARLSVYDRSWKLIQNISLPGADTLHYPRYKIAFNSKYYVVNYGTGVDHDKQPHFTSVITKEGRVISTKESLPYEVSGINEHNIIYAILKPDDEHRLDSNQHPVRLISMNVKQKALKEEYIGPPYTRVNSLSFTNNNELVLTGTCMTTISQKLPKTPDGIFYYKQSLKR